MPKIIKFILKAHFAEDKNEKTIKEKNIITEFPSEDLALIYLGKKDNFNLCDLKSAIKSIIASKRQFDIDVKSFKTKNVSVIDFINLYIREETFANAVLWNVKTIKKTKKVNNTLTGLTTAEKREVTKAKKLAEAVNYARNYQVMAPNKLNSVTYASMIKKDFAGVKNVSVNVLNKKQISELKMGLLLSVNLGSAFEPRVVVLEYKGNPSSKEKTLIVGKGITFDAGGMNIKTGKFMSHMKYDMSGSAIAVAAFKAISELKPKSNVSVVMVITDNMISPIASTPDAVFTAMNGKTVEINNTDAEGRLALADGLTYAAKKLKATRLIDIATLTGAVIGALGHTYTGVWTTTEKAWKDFNEAAKRADENVWRMPLHKDFFKFMKGSKVADMKNTALDGLGGSSTAAMFLTQFTEGVEYIHLDVAGTADINDQPMGVMVRALVEVSK